MSSIHTETKFRVLFIAAAVDYGKAIDSPNKCLTDNFVELAREAGLGNDLRWPLESLQLAQLFEVYRTTPNRRDETATQAVRLYIGHHFKNNLQQDGFVGPDATVTDRFIGKFLEAAKSYDQRLRQLNFEVDFNRYKPARDIVRQNLVGHGMTEDTLTTLLEVYQRSAPNEQDEFLAALRADFDKLQLAAKH
jgi:hypothetical protein